MSGEPQIPLVMKSWLRGKSALSALALPRERELCSMAAILVVEGRQGNTANTGGDR
jgi:hypothetical protein